MESNNCNGKNTTENNLDLMSFDLGEAGGGKQIIFMHKSISETEHYVFTLGNAPQDTQENLVQRGAPEKEIDNTETLLDQQLLSNFRNRLSNLKSTDNQNEAAQANEQNLKLRCFKLTQTENREYLVEEYITPKGIANVARIFKE